MNAGPEAAARRSPALANVLTALYALTAVTGLVGTWFFNLRFLGTADQGYLQAWFANDASSSAAVDVIVVAVAASVFMVREGRRLGMRGVWLYVLLTPTIAVAFSFPLFLAVRERTLLGASRGATSAPDPEVAR